MSFVLRLSRSFAFGCACLMWVFTNLAAAQDIYKITAITERDALRNLDKFKGLGLGEIVQPASPIREISNQDFFALERFSPIRAAIDAEFTAYVTSRPGKHVGEGVAFDYRMFQRDLLFSDRSRFVLAGVVNRMDRAYKQPETCGEVRFIYRLTYVTTNGVASRLPMTLNVITNAVEPPATAADCSRLARAWLDAAKLEDKGQRLAERLVRPGAPLDPKRIGKVARIEINLQIMRAPAGIVEDFGGHADYLLKVFEPDKVSGAFAPQKLENQIDRDLLVKDEALRSKLLRWLLSKEAVTELDQGTIVIPREFLAKSAISVTPGGAGRSANQHGRGFIESMHALPGALTRKEIDQAIAAAEAAGAKLVNIRSAAGFEQRLNDISCSGCHQTRGIGGFHFLGVDWTLKQSANSIFIPGSPHFMGEQIRRADIIKSIAAAQSPDYSRGFSARPQIRNTTSYRGHGVYDGWGATCYDASPTGAGPVDASFKSWTCAKGLSCRVLTRTPYSTRFGVCTTTGRIGDPTETGAIEWKADGTDLYKSDIPAAAYPPEMPLGSDLIASHQMFRRLNRKGEVVNQGGFFSGSIRTSSCDNLGKHPEAACGRIASTGFNACVSQSKPNFSDCLLKHTVTAGMRRCSDRAPCRDDYICVATDEANVGTCIPPYFVFQFRVDGHPPPSPRN